ncbi:hypothetical protein KL86DES1_20531 [uncultured Desulfovibrio sp.]|uniref:Uncharacterized protein n=1 Tax=uncultured Desulfovibrio sp. TaxID=167968 RepID=A0A212L454_9BACT|nr:hypothetical protein KL86DES1_20531 [uncultured Desulfovibrio sp.]VZH33435.1 conserved protein of unknown function [Desulfovibrio sp. 86]
MEYRRLARGNGVFAVAMAELIGATAGALSENQRLGPALLP